MRGPKVVLRFEQLRIVALGWLGSQPQIYQCDDFLTSDECEAILRLAKAGGSLRVPYPPRQHEPCIES